MNGLREGISAPGQSADVPSMPTKSDDRHRLQLDFSPEAYTRLLEIRKLAGARTNAEVVRSALRLYEWFLERQHEQFRLQLVKDDVVKEVEILF